MKKIIVRIAFILVAFVCMVGIRSCNKNKQSDEVHQQALAIVHGLPEYDENKAFFDEALMQYLSLIHI